MKNKYKKLPPASQQIKNSHQLQKLGQILIKIIIYTYYAYVLMVHLNIHWEAQRTKLQKSIVKRQKKYLTFDMEN